MRKAEAHQDRWDGDADYRYLKGRAGCLREGPFTGLAPVWEPTCAADLPSSNEPWLFAETNYIMQYSRQLLKANDFTFEEEVMEWTRQRRGPGHFVGLLIESLFNRDISLREFSRTDTKDVDGAVQLFTT